MGLFAAAEHRLSAIFPVRCGWFPSAARFTPFSHKLFAFKQPPFTLKVAISTRNLGRFTGRPGYPNPLNLSSLEHAMSYKGLHSNRFQSLQENH
jgi:hypothetical protein